MSTDPIRDLLAKVAKAPLGLEAGWLAVTFGEVTAYGGDLDAVREWVVAHGGDVDGAPRSGPSGNRPGRVMESASTGDGRRFVFPASALDA